MDEEDCVGCISCMSTNDLCDLFAVYAENEETYAKMFETCFDIKVTSDLKYICAICAENLEKAAAFKEQTTKNMSVLQNLKDEEYLDEAILEEADCDGSDRSKKKLKFEDDDDLYDELDEEHAIQALDETTCIYCSLTLPTPELVAAHIRSAHELSPRSGRRLRECARCGLAVPDHTQHMNRCHSVKSEIEGKKYPCHFCDNVYNSKKACFTHLRMKHGHFMLFKSAIQEETKYRFRKTTASKQTIEGVRSHYMCSQSGVYVYQGKGKRPAPERQIYKTGKACPAHMIVTETMDRVLVTFYKTHVGHGPCPYFEPREPKKPKTERVTLEEEMEVKTEDDIKHDDDDGNDGEESWICDTCGVGFLDECKFRDHVATHSLNMFPCQYCDEDFQDLEAWTHHVRVEHNMASLF